MKVLHLTLKKKWFDMIASGEKKEEYREIKEYWVNRLCHEFKGAIGGDLMSKHAVISFTIKQFDAITFKNGYAKDAPTIKIECKDIVIETGKEKWGAEPGKEYFVIKLGNIL